jgi:hypothetical protein
LSSISTSSSLFDLNERRAILARLMARRVSLWSAITHGELTDAARASSRTRLADLPLTPEEVMASKAARATLGRAIREARLRATRGPAVVRRAREEPAVVRRSRTWLWAIAGAILLLFVGWFLLVGTPSGPLADQARGGAGGGRTVAVVPPGLSRGRTLLAPPPLVVGPIVVATTAPSSGSNAEERPDPADRAGGAGGGGGGGGGGLISGPPLASPVQPSPPAPTGYTRFHGRVISASTGAAIQGVCVVIGSLDCDPNKPHTNELGYWTVDLTTQPYWDFTFKLSGYREVTVRQYANDQMDVLVPDVKLSRQ